MFNSFHPFDPLKPPIILKSLNMQYTALFWDDVDGERKASEDFEAFEKLENVVVV